MAEIHEGGCVCGAVRYRIKGAPALTTACHCKFCQRRTGTAFGMGAYFKDPDVEIKGTLKAYEHRSDESGRWLRIEFCPTCGATVTWTVEAFPGMRAVGVGTFDDPIWVKIRRHGWTRSAHSWVVFPADVEVFEKSALVQQPKT